MKKTFVAIAMMSCLALAGCASSSESAVTYTEPSTVIPVNDHTLIKEESTVFVYRDGRVTSQDVELFGEDYYDVEELKKDFVNPAIESYNKTAGGDSVKVTSVKAENGKVKMVLEYATTDDYIGFNKKTNKYYSNWATFDVCEYAKISEAGYALPATLLDTTGAVVNTATIKSNVELYLCVIDFGATYPTGFAGEFDFEGDIAYVSEGITVTSMNGVTAANGAGLQYIIFK